jgi:hypothetical protein
MTYKQPGNGDAHDRPVKNQFDTRKMIRAEFDQYAHAGE